MTKQVVQLEIDMPDGLEATGEYRTPNPRDIYLHNGVARVSGTIASTNLSIILRRKFVWPDWVKPGTWYVKNESGSEYLADEKPQLFSFQWVFPGESMQIKRKVADFPEVDVGWRKSLMQKPTT